MDFERSSLNDRPLHEFRAARYHALEQLLEAGFVSAAVGLRHVATSYAASDAHERPSVMVCKLSLKVWLSEST